MEQPIISPWFIYLLGVVGPIKASGLLICMLSAIAFSISLVIYWDKGSDLEHINKEEQETRYNRVMADFNRYKKILKISEMIFFIILAIEIFVPTRNTIIAMYIANNVTYSTIDNAEDKIEHLLDKTLEKAVRFNRALEEGKRQK